MSRLGRIFISYSRDTPRHHQHVRDLAVRLQADGLACVIDQPLAPPADGWPQWMYVHAENAAVIVVICTQRYRDVSRGQLPRDPAAAEWECVLNADHLWSLAERCVVVLLEARDESFIPDSLAGAPRFYVWQRSGYEDLVEHLRVNGPRAEPAAIAEGLRREPGRSLIDRDMLCTGCGYNLRTQSMNGICPECGLPVRESFNAESAYTGTDFASDNYAIASAQDLEQAGMPAMIEALTSDIIYRRKAAAYALAQIGPGAADAVPQLIAALRDRNADVRWWAAYALGNIGPAARPAAAALEQTVRDADEEVAAAAEESLRKISAPSDQQDSGQAPAAANEPGTNDDLPMPLPDPHLMAWPPPNLPRPAAPPPPGHPHHQVVPPPDGPTLGPVPQAPSWATWGAAQAPPHQAPIVPGDTSMKWEYKTIVVKTNSSMGEKIDTREIDETLNKLGWDDWELVATFDNSQYQGGTKHVAFVFKRPMSK